MKPAKNSALKAMQMMHDRARELSIVRLEIREREEKWKKETDELFDRERALKEGLLADLNVLGLSSVKDKQTGDSYAIVKTQDFKFPNFLIEEKWARENRCTRVDRVAMKQHLRMAYRKGELPEDVEVIEKETISVRKAKEPEDKPEDMT